jgi:hypothetical protein
MMEVTRMAGEDTGARLDEDSSLSAEESLALIERQQREVHRRLGVNVALFYGPWGAAYLFGFGSVFLTYPSAVPLRLPGGVAAVITGVLFAAAIVVSVVNGTRPGAGSAARPGWSGRCMAGAGLWASARWPRSTSG